MSVALKPFSNHVGVKICGITRPQDAVAAAQAGADAIGLNFFSGPRRINLPQAREILTAVRGQISAVGLVDFAADGAFSADSLFETLGLETFQMYNVSPGPITFNSIQAQVQFWLVVPIAVRADMLLLGPKVAGAPFPVAAVLLDAAMPGRAGGTGRSFDCQWIPATRAAGELTALPPLVLAGGLTPQNVAAAIETAQPDWVDVAGGVEAGVPGIKDHTRMRDFIRAVQKAWQQ